MTRLDAFRKMKELMTLYYIEAKSATDKPIAWLTSGAPVEWVYAMGALPVYPENYAAMCAAGHQSVALMQAAEAAGFSQDICAYARTDFGQDLLRGGPAGGETRAWTSPIMGRLPSRVTVTAVPGTASGRWSRNSPEGSLTHSIPLSCN